ncbi:unnamed protein product [Rotaria sordida]|uniref:Uncharacterized protein n=1 Tax=Rotaria sordida TaxID=392033 RepID=A0A813MDC0_9BILA|nr:unnamed protein product [Rotaria sordida]CAF0759536.1 unnamed protein product [Rotaria sordida]CAF0760895.1 unnamed protein product [Rotaria sordida]
MKFQRRILPPHSPTYLEMEEYTTPSSSHQSISITGSTSDLSEIGSVYSLSIMPKQRSDSLTNLFNMSEDSTSLSNLSIASYSLSQNSCENGSYTNTTTYTTLSPVTISSQQYATSINNDSDRISRKQYSSSYRSLTEEPDSPVNNRKLNLNNNNNNNNNNSSRRSGDSTRHYHFCSPNISGNSSTTSSLKSFPIKTAETVLNTIGINKSSSNDDLTDKCGLIAHDANDIGNNDDGDNGNDNKQNHNQQHQYDDIQSYCDTHCIDSSDENELDMTSLRNSSGTTQTGRGLRKTVLSNVDRLLNSGNKQIKF